MKHCAKKLQILFVICAGFLVIPNFSYAGGSIGDFVEGVGKATGIKPIEDLGRNADEEHRRIKEKNKIYSDVEEGVSRPIRETAKWVDNNKETVAAVAVVAAVGWAACADGCTFVGSLIAGGLTVPIVTADVNSPEESQPSGASQETKQNEEEQKNDEGGSGYEPSYEKEYPPGYSKVEYPDGVPPKLVYRSTRDELGKIFNEFAFPTAQAVVRYPGCPGDTGCWDPAGGILESPRNSMIPERYVEEYGTDARRVHGGIDFLTFPGEGVMAPMTGTVVAATPMKDMDGLQIVVIESADGTIARTLYTEPSVKKGDKVSAGQVIGRAQNIGVHYNLDTVPNHVHVDYTDYQNRRFDPWTNKIIDRRGP